MVELIYPSSPAPVLPRPNAMHPGPAAHSSEMLPVVEEDGIVIAQASRSYCHSGSRLLHPVVHLHIIDRFGRIYLQRRSPSKELYPGFWDTAVGGHVTYGETAEEALYREAEEELGLRRFIPQPLGSYVWETARDREFVLMWAAVGSFELSPDAAEVAEGRWFDAEEIDNPAREFPVTPNFLSEFASVRKSLYALL